MLSPISESNFLMFDTLLLYIGNLLEGGLKIKINMQQQTNTPTANTQRTKGCRQRSSWECSANSDKCATDKWVSQKICFECGFWQRPSSNCYLASLEDLPSWGNIFSHEAALLYLPLLLSQSKIKVNADLLLALNIEVHVCIEKQDILTCL